MYVYIYICVCVSVCVCTVCIFVYLYQGRKVGGQIGMYVFAYLNLLADVLSAHPARILATPHCAERGGS